MALDSSVVYLTVALPAGLRTHLPPLTENWKDFIQDQRWQRRWVSQRDQDRRQVPRNLIASISRSDAQPTLYFAHALLPHEPYVYLRSGQEFTDDPRLIGLNQTGRWTTDPWPVTVAYQRHLLQLEYVDAIVGAVIDRLKAEGLYDQALVVVTSDHGVSFRPGIHFKGLYRENLTDIMSVPLLIKAPHQRQRAHRRQQHAEHGRDADDRGAVEDPAHVDAGWATRRGGGVERHAEDIRHGGARLRTTVEADVLAGIRDASVARKMALFGEGPGWRAAAASAPRPDRPARGHAGDDRRAMAGDYGRCGSTVHSRPGWRHGAGLVDGPHPRRPRRAVGRQARHRRQRRRHGRGQHVPSVGRQPRVVGGDGQPGAVHQGPQRRPRLRDPCRRATPSPGVLVARAARAPQPGVARRRRNSGR